MKYQSIIKLVFIPLLLLAHVHSEHSLLDKTKKEELEESYQNLKGKKALLSDLLNKVLDSKDDKDNPEIDQSLQELQSLLSLIPSSKNTTTSIDNSTKKESVENAQMLNKSQNIKDIDDDQDKNLVSLLSSIVQQSESINVDSKQDNQQIIIQQQQKQIEQQQQKLQQQQEQIQNLMQAKQHQLQINMSSIQSKQKSVDQEQQDIIDLIKNNKVRFEKKKSRSSQTDNDQKNTDDSNSQIDKNGKDKDKRRVYEKYWEIFRPQEEIEQEKKNNVKAESFYQKDSQGNDKDERSTFEGNVLLKRFQKEIPEEQNNYRFQDKFVRVNGHSIYESDFKESGYRGIEGFIDFENIISEDDDTVNNKCCQNIYQIEDEKIGDKDIYCFLINSKYENWNVCSYDRKTISQWRSVIGGFIIVWDLKRKGIYDNKGFQKIQKDVCAFPIGWNYVNQEQWPCMCAEGMYQSPININKQDVKQIFNARTVWGYQPGYNMETHQLWKETVIDGDLGRFVYIDEKFKKTKYRANQVRFKFPSEHSVDFKFYDGEMQIVHTSEEGEKAISSFFLTAKNQNYQETDKLINSFMVDLYPNRKEHKAGFKYCLDAKPDLIGLLYKESFSLSFYTYMGSDTLPPCYEDVRWFIYATPLDTSQLMIDKLKEKLLGGSGFTNQRDQMPLMDRVVEYFFDACQQPPEEIPQNFQFVKAEHVKEYIGIVGKEEKLGWEDTKEFKEKKLTLEELDEEQEKEIPEHIKDTLIKKHLLYRSGRTPEAYDWYSDKSKWKEDYAKLTGDIVQSEMKEKVDDDILDPSQQVELYNSRKMKKKKRQDILDFIPK